MSKPKDLPDLLEEVQGIFHGLREEKLQLQDQIKRLEAQLSVLKEEKSKDVQTLQKTNTRLSQELQETKSRLSNELQDTQQKLDRFHPELQSLQNELQNAELQNNLLQVDLSKKIEEIKNLETRLSTYTSLDSPSMVEEPIV